MIKCRLKILLAEHDITQKILSDATGIRQASISDMCQNKAKQYPVETLEALCKYFDCTVSDILDYKKD